MLPREGAMQHKSIAVYNGANAMINERSAVKPNTHAAWAASDAVQDAASAIHH